MSVLLSLNFKFDAAYLNIKGPIEFTLFLPQLPQKDKDTTQCIPKSLCCMYGMFRGVLSGKEYIKL